LQNLNQSSELRAIEQGGIFIVLHLLWHMQGLGFSGLIRRTAPFSCLLRHPWGCGGSILTRILTCIVSHGTLFEKSQRKRRHDQRSRGKLSSVNERNYKIIFWNTLKNVYFTKLWREPKTYVKLYSYAPPREIITVSIASGPGLTSQIAPYISLITPSPGSVETRNSLNLFPTFPCQGNTVGDFSTMFPVSATSQTGPGRKNKI
jgi:hypothetical protein